MPNQPDEQDPSGRAQHARLEDERDVRTGRGAAAERIRNQGRWVDLQVQRAIERGEFDDLPGTGKPLDLPDKHDPDWWVKQLIEREQITGVAPAAIGLRKEDVELDGLLDREATPDGVRRIVADFNARIIDARRQLTGGPPVVTRTRDVEGEVARWRSRREARRARAAAEPSPGPEPRRRGWWRWPGR